MDVKVNCDWQYYQLAVTKIWQILDIETYEQAKGKSIDELVATLKQQRDDLLEACKTVTTSFECLRLKNAPHCRQGDMCCICEVEAAIAKCE